MSLFNIQELIEHAESTKQEIRGNWYPVRPKQLSGLGGLKQRIHHALQVLTGKADAVEWSFRPIKKKPTIANKEVLPGYAQYTYSAGCIYKVPENIDLYSFNVFSFRHNLDHTEREIVPKPTTIPTWRPFSPGSKSMIGQLYTGVGPQVTLIYDATGNTITIKGVSSIKVGYKVL
ncbi:hypothetical protein D5W64_13160 [Salmonella enterica subsp. enterica serovar Saintpaul]|nr:hypothetical protein [Salmonella enterica subsp. enterica serovar Saintpaul]